MGPKGTDKIDILSVVKGALTPDQKTIAISIWKKVGCFDTLSDYAHTIRRFREEEIIARTFYNYNYDKDYNALVRYINQIIDYYRCEFTNGKGVNQIARLTYVRKKGTYTLICKPTNAERLSGFNFRTSSAATNMDRARKIQKDDPLVITADTFKLVLNKLCGKNPLEARPELLKEFSVAVQEKLIEVSTELALLESSEKLKADIENGSDRDTHGGKK